MKKEPLLFLSHRIPYPPNKGDKIRSWHLLKHLAKNYKVYLGTFVDDEQDWQYLDHVKDVCEATYFVSLDPKQARIKSLSGLVKGEPLTLPYYENADLASWVEQIIETKEIKTAVAYSSAVAQYLMCDMLPLEKKIIDFVDVDSDKWEQYAQNKIWPLNLIYRREAKKLLAYDDLVAKTFDHSLFVSNSEAELFKRLSPSNADKVDSYNNGVDCDYFSPNKDYVTPYLSDSFPIVFTGAMDYWPNIDAVENFAENIFPQVRAKYPNAVFYIVGSNPTAKVRELSKHPNITVTGRVEDVRPYLHHAALAVAPMRVARGIQNKVLEAMAMKKLVVVSPQGLEGIHAVDCEEIQLARTADAFVNKINEALSQLGQETSETQQVKVATSLAEAARARILSDFDWEKNLAVVDQSLTEGSHQQASGLHLVKKVG